MSAQSVDVLAVLARMGAQAAALRGAGAGAGTQLAEDDEARAAVAELIEAARDFKAASVPPGSDDFSADDAAEFAAAWRRLDAALVRCGGGQ